MSLESKIEELTAAVNILTKAIQNQTGQPAPAEPEKTAAPAEPEKTAAPAEPEKTADDLKRLCMSKVRENREFKDTLKAFLKRQYGVTKTSEVPADKVEEAYGLIEKGEV